MENKQLNDFVKLLCAQIETYPYDGISHTCPTGEPYKTYNSHGIKAEGKENGLPFVSAQGAIESYINYISALPEIIKGKGTLYWRLRPYLDVSDGYMVRSRFIISQKPIDKNVIRKYFLNEKTTK